MSWVAVGSAVSAGASIYGARKNADSIESGADRSAQVQQQALDASLAINEPTQRLANSAQRQLASLFGLPDPGEIDFNAVGGGGRSGVFDPSGGVSRDQQSALDAITQGFGTDPISNPEAYLGIDQTTLPSDRLRNQLNNFKSAFGYDPTSRDRNPHFDETLQSQQTQGSAAPGFSGNLTELISNNPLVKFNIEQGEEAISRGAAARGLNASGRTLQDLTTFNNDQNLAAGTNFVLNPLFQLAGFGPQANQSSLSAIQGTAANQSNLIGQAADARGSAYQSGFNDLADLGGAISLRSLANRNTISNNPYNPTSNNPYNPSPPPYTLFGGG